MKRVCMILECTWEEGGDGSSEEEVTHGLCDRHLEEKYPKEKEDGEGKGSG